MYVDIGANLTGMYVCISQSTMVGVVIIFYVCYINMQTLCLEEYIEAKQHILVSLIKY